MVHTGAMIALMPTTADAQRLAIDDGEDADQLHITVMYLGEAALIPPEVRDALVNAVERATRELPTIVGKIFAVNAFNPAQDQQLTAGGDPCVVWGVSGELLHNTYKLVAPTVQDVFSMFMLTLEKQHVPWVPHITAAYVAPDDEIDVSEFAYALGAVTFDRIRLAFGDNDIYDISLGGCHCASIPDDYMMSASGVTAQQERDVNLPGGGHNLRNYWVRGPGAAKIGWGTDGSFARCVAHLSKYVTRPQGLCAEYHKQATGEWPAEKGIPSEGETVELNSDADITMANDPKKPYGDVPYADPGYQDDGIKRYPIDTEAHIRAAWAYINMPKNAEQYDRMSLRKVRVRIAEAMQKLGVDVTAALDEDIIAAALLDDTKKSKNVRCVDDVYATEILAPRVTPISSAAWNGILTVEGVESGDGRMFAPGSLTWDEPPLPLMWQKETSHGGDNNVSVRVGSIQRVWREPAADGSNKRNLIMGEGTLDLGSADGREVFRRMRDGDMRGNSVDVDSVKNSNVELRFPAPITDENGVITQAFTQPDLTTYKAGRIRASTMVEIPAFTEARLTLTNTDALHVPMADTESIDAMSVELVAATNVIEITDAPPREWFSEPTDVTPQGALTITPQGRIYGYVAPAGVRHRSFSSKNQYVPLGNVDYSRFMSGETIIADGGRVATGRITMNCGHATTKRSLTASQAAEHYDNSCSIVATVCVGENEHGVWMAGALLPDLTPATIQRMMACSLSGDWRAHLDKPGMREFVAALLVPVPGFPMARRAASVEIADGQLVASTIPVVLQAPNVDDSNDNDEDDEKILQLHAQREATIAALVRKIQVMRLRSVVAGTRRT